MIPRRKAAFTRRGKMLPANPSACGAESPSYRHLAGGNGSIARMRVEWDTGEVRQSPGARFAAAPDAGRCCWGMTETGNTAVMPVILRIALEPMRGERYA